MTNKYSITLDFNADNIDQATEKFINFCRDEHIEVLEDTFLTFSEIE